MNGTTCKYSIATVSGQRGIALITALLATTLMLAMGLAVVYTASNDTMTTTTYRTGEQAFHAADAGIGIARRAFEQAFAEQIQTVEAKGDDSLFYIPAPAGTAWVGTFPAFQVFPDPSQTTAAATQTFFNNVVTRSQALAATSTGATTRATTLSGLDGAQFTATFSLLGGSVNTTTTPKPPAGQPWIETQTYLWRYAIQVTGTTVAGGKAVVNESGNISSVVSVGLNLNATTASTRKFSFSGFAAFFDNGDAAGGVLASGTFTGPVHTNTHFAFSSGNSLAFTNVVSSVDNYIVYDGNNQSLPTQATEPTGISVTAPPQGYQQVATVPLPTDSFSQEYAVINETGITAVQSDGITPVDKPAAMPVDSKGNPVAVFDSSGRVTVQALAANLVGASDKQPAISGRVLANGVYVASGDGKNASGGIYVMGDASDMMLSTSGTDQIYTITQGSTVTTITVSQTNNTTTISSGTNTTKLSGIPMNNADPSNPAPGAALYVNGNINALHGPKGGGKTGPAIAPGTALTITGSRMITVTGDLTYANPVVDGSGNALASDSTIKNVLGIFTADGNVGLAPDSTYTSSGLSLEIDAAISTFNTNTSDDNGKIEGSITYTGSNKTSNTDLWKLVGSRVQASINNIGYSKRNIYFDPRFSGGTFAPPFYPGTSYALSNVTTTTTSRPAVASFVQPGSQAVSWFRTSN